MDTKVTSNGNFNVSWVPLSGILDPNAPTAAELNAGLALSEGIAMESFELAASESNDIDDRSILDAGNAVSAGYEQFSASMEFFRDADLTDNNSTYNQIYHAFKKPHQTGYLILRVLQNETGQHDPYKPGDTVSVFRVMSDAVADNTEGETSYKLSVTFQPQGFVKIHTLVAGAGQIVIEPAGELTVAVGEFDVINATIDGKSWTQGVTWRSSDTSVASVDANGVVIGVSPGSVQITATHPGATASEPLDVIVT